LPQSSQYKSTNGFGSALQVLAFKLIPNFRTHLSLLVFSSLAQRYFDVIIRILIVDDLSKILSHGVSRSNICALVASF